MAFQNSLTLRLRAWGSLACFTRPELKVERVSYPVMTPSAARGLLEAVLWKPAIVWCVERIHVLKEIKFTDFRRNEVTSKAFAPAAATIKHGGPVPAYFADEDRAQRSTVALSGVDYIVEAHFAMTDKAGADDNMNKFVEMFNRRVEKGQHFHQPYFGCREFVAHVVTADGAPPPIGDSRDLGLMLWDIRFSKSGNEPVFFAARLTEGTLEVPADPHAPISGTARRKGGEA
ncbi:MAG: type I-C CRISPR-associated protein Cas5c [Terriglobia bacterium]